MAGVTSIVQCSGGCRPSFLPFASEAHALGLAKEVRDLAANASVMNSGNVSAPPPPPTLWALYWNALAGLASAVWNAVVAVGNFFRALGKWLVGVAIGVAIGLSTGNWTSFRENVIEPLQEALEALVSFIVELIQAIFKTLLEAAMVPVRSLLNQLASLLTSGTQALVEFWNSGTEKSLEAFSQATLGLRILLEKAWLGKFYKTTVPKSFRWITEVTAWGAIVCSGVGVGLAFKDLSDG